MEVFRELYLTGELDALAALPEALTRRATGPWRRDPAREASVARPGGAQAPDERLLCFARDAGAGAPSASLWIAPRLSERRWYVSNIVPIETNRLSRAEYNGLVTDFADRVARPAAGDVGAQVEVTEPETGLEQWMPAPLAGQLRAFWNLANKSTGSSHPLDAARWHAFVIAAHRANVAFNSTMLARWLHEEEAWGADQAQDLAVEYDEGRALLAAYDRDRADGDR